MATCSDIFCHSCGGGTACQFLAFVPQTCLRRPAHKHRRDVASFATCIMSGSCLDGQQASERISAQMCSMDEARAFCVNSVVLCTPRAWIRMRKKHSFKMRPFRDCILLAPGGWRPGLRCRTLVTREAVGSFAFTSVLTFGPPPMSSSLHVYTSFLTISGTSASAAAVSTSGSSSSSSLSAVGRLSEVRGCFSSTRRCVFESCWTAGFGADLSTVQHGRGTCLLHEFSCAVHSRSLDRPGSERSSLSK